MRVENLIIYKLYSTCFGRILALLQNTPALGTSSCLYLQSNPSADIPALRKVKTDDQTWEKYGWLNGMAEIQLTRGSQTK
jgi:hypothetical protein